MGDLFLGIASAAWLGILTSISPCPLATNIAAVSFLGQRVRNPQTVFFSGLQYAAGRTLTYLTIGILLVSSLLSAPYVSQWLQRYMNKLLGPILVIAGMFLLELLRLKFTGSGVSEKMQERAKSSGAWAALLLGVLFALSFCPVSAALFFGSLIPIAVQSESAILIPSFYGVGTALPVLVFATLIAMGVGWIGSAFDRLVVIERWARRVTGFIFIVVGIYYCLAYIFGVFA